MVNRSQIRNKDDKVEWLAPVMLDFIIDIAYFLRSNWVLSFERTLKLSYILLKFSDIWFDCLIVFV